MTGENVAALDAALNTVSPETVPVAMSELVSLRQRAKAADSLEREIADTKLDVALSNAMAGISWTDEVAAAHARQLISSRLTVRPNPETGRMEVVERATGRPAAEAIRDLAAGAEFARYQSAGHVGGAGMSGGFPAEGPGGMRPEDQVKARREAMTRAMLGDRETGNNVRTFGNPLGYNKQNGTYNDDFFRH